MRKLILTLMLSSMVGCCFADTMTKIDDKTVEVSTTVAKRFDILVVKKQIQDIDLTILNFQRRKSDLQTIVDNAKVIGVDPALIVKP